MSALRRYIIGIDPSLAATGIATREQQWTVNTRAKGDDRLQSIYRSIMAGIHRGNDTLAVVEDLPTGAHGAGKTGMAQGVVRLALLEAKVPYVTVPAATLKKYATGRGNATKPDMRMALYQRADLDLRDDNQVDAWWLRQMGLDAVGHDDAITLPKTHREAMLKVAWPEDITARLLQPYEAVTREVVPT